MRDEVKRVEQGECGERTIDDGNGNLWLVRRVSPKTPDFGSVAVDLGAVSGEALADMRQRIDDTLADAAATLEQPRHRARAQRGQDALGERTAPRGA